MMTPMTKSAEHPPEETLVAITSNLLYRIPQMWRRHHYLVSHRAVIDASVCEAFPQRLPSDSQTFVQLCSYSPMSASNTLTVGDMCVNSTEEAINWTQCPGQVASALLTDLTLVKVGDRPPMSAWASVAARHVTVAGSEGEAGTRHPNICAKETSCGGRECVPLLEANVACNADVALRQRHLPRTSETCTCARASADAALRA